MEHSTSSTSEAPTQEEIIIMSSVNDMAKHFLRENVIIWYDRNVDSPENTAHFTKLKNICAVQVFADWKEASNYLNKETQLPCCQVITSGTDGELFVKEISCLPFISSIYVYNDTDDINDHKAWASQYSKIVCVEEGVSAVLDKIRPSVIRWQRTSSSLRIHLPSFAPIFDDVDLSEMNNLQLYLQGFINFENRSQAKKDFLNLARALYGKKNKYIKQFEKNYNEYAMKAILNWYTKECFLYKLTNNCLRKATSDSIQYCRLVLKDLEDAIRDKYRQSSYNVSGLLYRGAYLSDDEWTRLQQNLNQEIEMHGFLSTTKKKDIAIAYCQEDMNKKVMTTIIVPNFPEKGEQGFAEMGEYTDFPEEEEVLFNVRSRFTILEATLEEIGGIKMRHLVLLYGAQAMRRYTTLHNPSIEVQISITETTKCNKCKRQINVEDTSAIAIDIYENDKYLCKDCLKQFHQTEKLVLFCFSPLAYRLLSASSEKNNRINLKIEGTFMRYQESLNVPFYGNQCVICKGRKLNCCYKCVNCKDANMIYCNICFHNQSLNNCLRTGHKMIGQGYPFCFWSDKMSQMEEHHLDYHKEQLEQTRNLSEQGRIFLETHNYEKAIEYYQKYLAKNGDLKNEATARCYNNLGITFLDLGEYHKAINCLSKSLEINNAVFGNNHPDTAGSYNNLGTVYDNLEEYQKAIEYHYKSLGIREAVFGDNHSDTATSYNNLGGAYYKLEEYQKAIKYHSKSLKIREAVFGNNHPDTAVSYNNLGTVYDNLEEYQKAIDFYTKSLEIHKSVFGNNHPETATSYNNLGGVYNKLEEYKKAIECYSKSLKIRKAVFGNNHHDIATSYNNLGVAYQYFGESQKAIECLSKSLDIRETVFGNNHPETAASYNNLGQAYNKMGEYKKAIKYHSNSLEIRETVFGNNHHKTAMSYNNLGLAYQDLGEYQKAIEYHTKSLDIRKAVFGNNHHKTAISYNNLGLAYQDLGEYQKAIEYHSKSLDVSKAVFGNNHPDTAASFSNLGISYRDLGEYQKAIEYHSKSLDIRKAVFGNNHPETAASYNNLGVTSQNLREYQKAIEYYSKSIKINEAMFENGHPNTATSYTNLGVVYGDLGEYLKAIVCHYKSLKINKAVFGNNHPGTAYSLNHLGVAYAKLGEYQKAIEYYTRSLAIRKAVLGNDHPKTADSYESLEFAEQAYHTFLK